MKTFAVFAPAGHVARMDHTEADMHFALSYCGSGFPWHGCLIGSLATSATGY